MGFGDNKAGRGKDTQWRVQWHNPGKTKGY
jgi:hypothetical protein